MRSPFVYPSSGKNVLSTFDSRTVRSRPMVQYVSPSSSTSTRSGKPTRPDDTGRPPSSGGAGRAACSPARKSARMASWLDRSLASEITIILSPASIAASASGPDRSEPSPYGTWRISPEGPKRLSVNWVWRGSIAQPGNSWRRNSITER